MIFSTAVSGLYDINLPQWGRCFWQDPNDGELFLAYGSGASEVNFITSADSGNSWSEPEFAFYVDDFTTHNNFDTIMDRKGHVHCGFRLNSSGCYTILGKTPGGGWSTASGVGPVGWVSAGDSGVVKGFQGSLTIHEAPFIQDIPGVVYPAVKLVAKDSGNVIQPAFLGWPYTGTPIIEDVGFLIPFTGENGGFPLIFTDGNQAGSSWPTRIIYFDEVDYDLHQLQRGFGTEYDDHGPLGFGQGDVLFAPNMSIGSGIGGAGNASFNVVATSSGQAVFSNVNNTGFGNSYINTTDINQGTDKYWRAQTGFENGGVTGVLVDSGVMPTGLIYGVGPNLFSSSGVTVHDFPGAGTNCDFSFNDAGEYILYFQKKNEWGRQCIGRVKATYDGDELLYTELGDTEFGLKHPCEVSNTHTGGFSNFLFWSGFKALKHPTEPQDNPVIPKKEMIVTNGHVATYPSGGILTIWDIDESPALARFQAPEYSFDYTLTSGTANEIFVGVAGFTNVTFSSHYDILPNMFDDSNDTFGSIADGYTLTLELDTVRTIDRIEILDRSLTLVPRVIISGSMDGINHSRIVQVPSGRHIFGFNEFSNLRKIQAATPTVIVDANALDQQPIFDLDPFAAKFVTFQFESSTQFTSRIYEIKLYGPGKNSPEIITWADGFAVQAPYTVVNWRQSKAPKTENFNQGHGNAPNCSRTYGDFEWRIVGSGESTRTSSLPTAPLSPYFDGLVQSGVWQFYDPGQGVGDGFSLRSEAIGDASGLGSPLGPVPAGGIQPGHSGVFEIDINILESERAEGFFVASRTISFYLRSDMHIDDRVEFYHLSPIEVAAGTTGTLSAIYGDWTWSSEVDSPEPYGPKEEFTFTQEGHHILRWIYRKGEYDPLPVQVGNAPSLNATPYGAAWIDQIAGLDPPIANARWGYLKGTTSSDTGVIHGYLEGKGFSQIHGVMPLVDPLDSFIHGYINGSPEGTVLSETIHGYLSGKGISIHGYLLGSSGVVSTTFPTGSIHGYVAAADSGGMSSIHGYVLPYNQSSIWGYLRGDDDIANALGGDGDLKIHGYTLANYPNSVIHGVVNSSGNVAIESIHGILQARFGIGDQVIHGYVGVVSGVAGQNIRKGFALGWNQGPDFFRDPQTMIYGYLTTPVDSGNSQIHAYMLAQFPVSSIHGYMGNEALVASGGGTVDGGPGGAGASTSNVVPGSNWIHGYLKGVDGFQFINGYVLGPPGGTSLRKGYVLGGAENTQIHGYMNSFEIGSGNIHGYASGIGYQAPSIHGWAFGISGIINSQVHGYLSSSEDLSTKIWGTLIGTQPPATGDAVSDCPSSADICPSHNFPLPPTLTITLPTGFLN